jgi:segregation and condensation protein B
MNLESKIEALLFFKGEPISVKEMVSIFEVTSDEVSQALNNLKNSLENRGVCLISTDEKVMLGTNSQMSDFFEKLRKDELNKELSKAAIETLSIILYKDSVSRSDINFIRGVNSSFILRNLEIRGLVDRINHKTDARSYVYKPSLELLSYLGVTSIDQLPGFENIRTSLQNKLLNQDSNNEAN